MAVDPATWSLEAPGPGPACGGNSVAGLDRGQCHIRGFFYTRNAITNRPGRARIQEGVTVIDPRSKQKLIESALKGHWFPVVLFSLIAVLTILDILADLAAGTTVFHVLLESLLVVVAMAGALFFWNRYVDAKQAQRDLKRALNEARAETARWHEEEEQLLHNLNAAINRQFTKWDFSPAERDIAISLLRGLSMKDIAKLRGSTPRSITQQAYVLYHKAGLGGRAELSAYFLGGLVRQEAAAAPSTGEPESEPGS